MCVFACVYEQLLCLLTVFAQPKAVNRSCWAPGPGPRQAYPPVLTVPVCVDLKTQISSVRLNLQPLLAFSNWQLAFAHRLPPHPRKCVSWAHDPECALHRTQLWRTAGVVRVGPMWNEMFLQNVIFVVYRNRIRRLKPKTPSSCRCSPTHRLIPPFPFASRNIPSDIPAVEDRTANMVIVTVSHIVHRAFWLIYGGKTRRPVAAAAGRCICRLPTSPAPGPSSLTLWCLCVFVNE